MRQPAIEIGLGIVAPCRDGRIAIRQCLPQRSLRQIERATARMEFGYAGIQGDRLADIRDGLVDLAWA